MQSFTCTGTFNLDVTAGEATITGSVDSVTSYPVWVRPEYKAGSIVSYNGKLYIAKRDNAYAPTSTTYWSPYTPA